MKKLIITQQKMGAMGFAKPQSFQLEGVEFTEGKAAGKLAIGNEKGEILVYNNREEAQAELGRAGKTEIQENKRK